MIDPDYHCIEDRLDMLESRYKAKEFEYDDVIKNRHLYEQWMEPEECAFFFRHQAVSLINFDPNWTVTS